MTVTRTSLHNERGLSTPTLLIGRLVQGSELRGRGVRIFPLSGKGKGQWQRPRHKRRRTENPVKEKGKEVQGECSFLVREHCLVALNPSQREATCVVFSLAEEKLFVFLEGGVAVLSMG
jgi:hypothetical protein